MSEAKQDLDPTFIAHAARLGRFCAAYLGQAKAAQAILEETFEAARGKEPPPGMASEVWLLGLVRSRCAQVLEGAASPVEGGPLAKAVAALRPTQREALLAGTVGGFSFAEIAQAFGVEPAAVSERAGRGLEQLRRALRPGGGEECPVLDPDLMAIANGDGEALARHKGHLASCDTCRDRCHDVLQVVPQLMELAADFRPALRDLDPPVPATPAATAPAKAPAAKPGVPSPFFPTPDASPFSLRTRLGLFVGLSVVAALGAVWLAKRHAAGRDASPTAIKVERIVHAASDGEVGLYGQAGKDGKESPLAAAATIPPGALVRTDDHTRAWLRFGDGGLAVLDHGTRVRLLATGLGLEQGEVMVETGSAARRLVFANGEVDLEDGRASFTLGDETSIRVLRGRAVVHGQGDTPVTAGQEALLSRAGRVRVANATGLATGSAWADGEDASEAGMAGLGELRARKPGRTRDREQPLRLASHKVTVRLLGPVARTEIDETFQNDGGDTLEGMYRFPLPADAQLERLALEVDGVLQEGSFVDRERAAAIWRGVIHHATPKAPKPKEEMVWVPGPWRDPALLEWQRGGRFELRIFPIPPRAGRRVIVAYTQAVAPRGEGRRYIYPLPHAANQASAVGRFLLDVKVSGANPGTPVKVLGYDLAVRQEDGATRLTLDRGSFLPAGDLVIDYQLPNPGAPLRSYTFQKRPGEPAYAMIALRPRLPAFAETKPRDHLILVDSSQSMAGERFARAARLATTLLSEMDRRDRAWVAACDLACQWLAPQAQTPSEATAAQAAGFFQRLRPAGSSNLVGSLRATLEQLRATRPPGRELRVLYLGDGVSTVGYRTPGALAEQVRRLRDEYPDVVVSAVGIGGDADSAALAAVVRAGGGYAIPYRPGERRADVARAVLESAYGVGLQDIALTWPAGVRELAPTHPGTLRDGDELVAFARFEGEVNGTLELRGRVGGQPYHDKFPLALTASTAPANAFVPRMWAAATIARLEAESPELAKPRIVELSKAFAVMSRHTSLLVLESPAMMHAFGVEQNPVANDWTGEGELEGEEAEGTLPQAGPTVTEAPARRSRDGASQGGGAGAMGIAAEQSMAPAPAMAKARPMQASKKAEAMDMEEGAMEAKRALPAPVQVATPPRPPEDPRRHPGSWMRKVWVKEARVATWHPRPYSRAVERAEQALAAAPDSRDRHRDLVRLLSRNGDLARAEAIAQQWLARDRMDAEALTAQADLLARQGEREESLRWLSGIVDLEPENKALHERMAAAFDRLGDLDRACAHRLVLAELSPKDTTAVYTAAQCESRGTPLLVAPPGKHLRAAMGVARYQVPRVPTRGDVVLDASWGIPEDLDLALISPQGTRISWMGGRQTVFADRVSTPGGERLGLRRASAGTYLIEVSRTDPATRHPVHGRIRLKALGLNQTLSFHLLDRQVVAGTLVIERKPKLVPVRTIPRRPGWR